MLTDLEETPKKKRGNPPGSNGGGGRRPVQINIEEVESHAARGLTLEKIALCMGFSPTTLWKNRKQSKQVEDAIVRGRAAGEKIIANALFKAAAAGHVEAGKFYLARRCDWRETTVNEHTGKDGQPIAHTVQMTISKDDAAL